MNVQFPGLGIEMEIDRVAISIGGFSIYWYAVIIMSGLLLAVWYAFRRAEFFGIKKDPMFDVVLIGFVCSIICARIYYVVFSDRSYNSFWEIINLRDGGIAIYGAVIGAFVSGALASKWRKIRVMAMFDVAAIAFLIGQGIGRWGNFMNQEAFGCATDLPWGMLSENTMKVVPDSPVHPCFLYESLWCFAGLAMLHFLSKKCYKFYGQYFLLYLLWYGLGRVWIEGLRTDSLWLVPDVIRVSQLVALLSLATVPLLVLGFRGKLFTQRLTDENGNAINAMLVDASDEKQTDGKKPGAGVLAAASAALTSVMAKLKGDKKADPGEEETSEAAENNENESNQED
ncbi:MAG: prolipoprotein diacylglyceryl transferase [Ruminococcaceae bacterium]|nr:prolipoprotein diacylglyceryl transferase [Oscillospiraceae bacterium]